MRQASSSGRLVGAGSQAVSSRNYLVARRLGRWRVTYEDAPIGFFDDPADATRFACEVARLEAQAGVATLVEVQGAVVERHYFVSIGVDAARFPARR